MEFVAFIVVVTLGYSLIVKFMGYYFGTKKNQQKLSHGQEEGHMHQVIEQAEQMEQRITMLETILDKDLPGWRKRI